MLSPGWQLRWSILESLSHCSVFFTDGGGGHYHTTTHLWSGRILYRVIHYLFCKKKYVKWEVKWSKKNFCIWISKTFLFFSLLTLFLDICIQTIGEQVHISFIIALINFATKEQFSLDSKVSVFLRFRMWRLDPFQNYQLTALLQQQAWP